MPQHLKKEHLIINLRIFKQNFGFLIGIAVLSALVSSFAIAQEVASVSGRVVNENGEAVADILVAVRPYKVMGNVREEGLVEHWQRQTDSEGRFSITDIMAAESVRFVVEGKHGEQTEIQILSVEIGELTLYPNDHPHFRGMPFSLEARMEIENAVIKVKTDIRPQVRARVVFADGTPVTNAQIPGFTINLSPVFQMSKADENGAFTFTNVPAGPVQIMIPPQQFRENGKPSFNLEKE